MVRVSILVSVVAVLIHGVVDAKPVKTLENGKTGSIEFESLSYPPRGYGGTGPFDLDDATAKVVVVPAELRIPRGDDRKPAMILTHGCGGLSGTQEGWARELGRMGFASLVVDTFGGRNIKEICTGRSTISSLDPIADVHRALVLLATHPRIDPTRIALMGFSFGGRTALWSSHARFRARFAPAPGPQFAAYLPFYPAVSMWKLIDDEEVGDRPIRIFQGGADDWTPAAPIESYVKRVRAAGHQNISLVVYEGAHHSFDDPQGPNPPRRWAESLNFTRCLFVEQPGGIPIDSETGGRVSTDLPCFSRGNSLGYHPQAYAKAIQDVKAFLYEIFGMR